MDTRPNTIILDYAIIGAGAAGINLLLAMMEDPFFREKKISVFDRNPKNTSDKTWCFWETGSGKWEKILTHQWQDGLFFGQEGERVVLDFTPYRYKMLRSIDFYDLFRESIRNQNHVKWIPEEITETKEENDYVILRSPDSEYRAKHVFDSRIDPSFNDNTDGYIRLLQQFTGWLIECNEPVFNPENFTMMDIRKRWKDTASFTYVLPVSPFRALVEFTLFTPDLIPENVYDEMLKDYIITLIGVENYRITKEEFGIIPMTDFPFHKANTDGITKIGTAGSWVKPSSGYSFKNAERYSQKIISNIKNNRRPDYNLFSKRFRWYDSILLKVLYHNNHLGSEIFTDMYTKNPTHQIFKFLNEETSLWEDLKIISSFPTLPFVKALFR